MGSNFIFGVKNKFAVKFLGVGPFFYLGGPKKIEVKFFGGGPNKFGGQFFWGGPFFILGPFLGV